MATRVSGGKVLNGLATTIPWLVGGSADLAPSTMTNMKDAGSFEAGSYDGRNFHFGIREHAMAAAVNGMVLSGLRSFGATFFVFADYCRPSIRLAAIMKLPSSSSSRTIRSASAKTARRTNRSNIWPRCGPFPDLVTLRPADANEVAEAYRTIMPWKNRPAAMVLTRQNLPTLDRTKYGAASGVARAPTCWPTPKAASPK